MALLWYREAGADFLDLDLGAGSAIVNRWRSGVMSAVGVVAAGASDISISTSTALVTGMDRGPKSLTVKVSSLAVMLTAFLLGNLGAGSDSLIESFSKIGVASMLEIGLLVGSLERESLTVMLSKEAAMVVWIGEHLSGEYGAVGRLPSAATAASNCSIVIHLRR